MSDNGLVILTSRNYKRSVSMEDWGGRNKYGRSDGSPKRGGEKDNFRVEKELRVEFKVG